MLHRMEPIVQLIAVLLLSVLLVTGCGDDGSPPPGVDVPIQGTVVTGPFSVESVTLSTSVSGDRFEADALTASIQRADGTTAPVDASLSAEGTTITVGRATLALPSDTANTAQSPSQADVRVVATVDAVASGNIAGVTLATRDPGDTLDIGGAKARVERADGTSDPIEMSINAECTEVRLGSFSLQPTPLRLWYWVLNRVVIDGPVSVTDGPTGTTTQIGSLAFSFGMAKDGTIVAPKVVRACIPTLGVASDRRVVVEGLTHQRDYVWASITDISGAVTFSKAYMADEAGKAIIPDTPGQFTAERLSGPKTHIEICFGNTYRRAPRPVPWPPVYDTVGPGEGDRTRLNVLVLKGPLGIKHGATGTLTQIGFLRLGFEVLPDGTVVAPESLAFRIPTRGMCRMETVLARGLQPGDFVQTRLVDNSGRVIRSPLQRATSAGTASVRNALGRLPASALSGPESSLSLFFARTDADGNGKPDWF